MPHNDDGYSQMTDLQLIVNAKTGDADAFVVLYQRYWRKLWSLCFKLVGKSEAEDLARQALLVAWKNLSRFNSEAYDNFGNWLLRIANNLCLDWLKTAKRRERLVGKTVSLDEPFTDDEEGITWKDIVPEKIADPDEINALQATLNRVWPGCWSGLSEDDQSSLLFIYFLGDTFKELGWQKGSKRIEPGDSEETKKKKMQSAHNNGKYYVTKALKNLEGCLSAKGLHLAPSRVIQLLQDQGSERNGGI